MLEDLSQRPAFSDHYMKDFRLSRANPRGEGATARFLLDRRDLRRSGRDQDHGVATGPTGSSRRDSVGRLGRSTLSGGLRAPAGHGRLPPRADHQLRAQDRRGSVCAQRGAHRWIRRNTKKALDRLRQLLEDPGGGPPQRVTVAGYEPHTAPRFGDHVQAPHEDGRGRRVDCPPRWASATSPARLRACSPCSPRSASRPAGSTRSRAWTSPLARGSRSTWAESTTTSTSRASSTSRSRRTAPTTTASRRAKGHALYGIFVRTCNEGTKPVMTAKNFTRRGQPGQRVRADRGRRGQRLRLQAAEARGGRLHPRGRQRGPARAHGRLDAALRLPAGEHGEPAAGAAYRGSLRLRQGQAREQDCRTRPLPHFPSARARTVAHRGRRRGTPGAVADEQRRYRDPSAARRGRMP